MDLQSTNKKTLKIAYISYEYPPETGGGGIGTYIKQVAEMMTNRGHKVHVFSASPYNNSTKVINGVTIHRIKTKDELNFAQLILPLFREQHLVESFDLFESPEYMSQGIAIKKAFPFLPMVVKLHTPQYLLRKINKLPKSNVQKAFLKLRSFVSGIILLRGIEHWKRLIGFSSYQKLNDTEYQITQMADAIHSPTKDLGDLISKDWSINRQLIETIPNPFIPNSAFLNIPINQRKCKTITFVGSLAIRKGILNLITALKIVLKKHTNIQIRFVGKSAVMPNSNLLIKDFIISELILFENNIEFFNVDLEEIPKLLEDTDICIFPSIWENFPNVCLEAMSAGRAVIGSKNGGMAEMIESGCSGVIIDPLKPKQIAQEIIKLFKDDNLRFLMGNEARKRILKEYNEEKIGCLLEKSYSSILNSKN